MSTASFAQPLPEHPDAEPAQVYPGRHHAPIPFELVGPWPPGSLSASAADMGVTARQLNADGSALLDRSTLALMHSPALGEDQLGGLAAGPRMALGFFEEDRNGHRILGHSGDLIHSHAALQLYPDHATGIFIALNGSGTRPDSAAILRSAMLEGFADRYFPFPDGASAFGQCGGARGGGRGHLRPVPDSAEHLHAGLLDVGIHTGQRQRRDAHHPAAHRRRRNPGKAFRGGTVGVGDSEGHHRVGVRVGETGG